MAGVGFNPLEQAVSGVGLDDNRITDPVTGAGLFVPNTDPLTTGIDPLTGLEAPVGTDVGFGAVARRFFAAGMYNSDFAVGPPVPDAPIVGDPSDAGYNPVPFWSYEGPPSGAAVASWGSDQYGGFVSIALGPGEASDAAWFECLMPSRDVATMDGNLFRLSYVKSAFGQVVMETRGVYRDQTLSPLTMSASDTVGASATALLQLYQPTWPWGYIRVRVGYKRAGSSPSGSGTATFRFVDAAPMRQGLMSFGDASGVLGLGGIRTAPGPEYDIHIGAFDIGTDPTAITDRTPSIVLSSWLNSDKYIALSAGPAYTNTAYATLGGNVNDYAPTGWHSCAMLAIDGGAANRTITGFVAPPSATEGTERVILNATGPNNIILSHGDAASAASARMLLPANANLTIRPRGGVALRWIGDSGGANLRWRCTSAF